MATVLVECWMFLRRHWPHVLALIVMAFAFTALHELAHALAVWGQGGSVIGFSVIPSGGEYGHVRYAFAADQSPNQRLIALAPYGMWLGFMIATGITAWWGRKEGQRFFIASSLFVWAYAGAWADIVSTWAGWLHGDANDWVVLGEPSRGIGGWLLLGGACVAAAWCGYFVQRGLYDRQTRLSAAAYGLLTIVIGSLLIAALVFRPDAWVIGK